MGIKIGLAVEAARAGLYVPLKEDNPRPLAYGKPFFFRLEKEEEKFYIRYLNGMIGHMKKNWNGQLEDFFIEYADWVPTEAESIAMNGGILPPHLVIFKGTHTVREVTDAELECLPPAKHRTDKQRFENPNTLWEEVIALCLNTEPQSILR